ncbi:hypothetical protein ABMA28_010960 [Loxostege sticticalis]|uniref:Uncharacterized protein n=1 Tax=Loxostege sticticalis TaxID=481309 RepID=A0ABD0S818_LOXSC
MEILLDEDVYGNTIFHELAEAGSRSLLERFARHKRDEFEPIIRQRNMYGESCVHVAAKTQTGPRAKTVMKLLKELGADLSATFNSWTVLHIAVQREEYELTRWLCYQNGVDKRAKNPDGLTAYEMACAMNNKKMIDLLKQYKADVQPAD